LARRESGFGNVCRWLGSGAPSGFVIVLDSGSVSWKRFAGEISENAMDEKRANILLVDDHALFRESLARFLESQPGLRVAGGCATLNEAMDFLRANQVDVVLLDFDLGQRDGLEFMRVAESIGYQGKVLLVTAGAEETSAANLVKHGIAGVFFKHDPPVILVEAIRQVLSGKVWAEQNYLHRITGHADANKLPRTRKLTEREQKVLVGVFEGLANKQIADRLQVSESSVKATLQQLFQKTGVRTRGQLVRIALEQYRELI
jgi:two-component system, NarL family, nitrate/nitrite response regulator NarL